MWPFARRVTTKVTTVIVNGHGGGTMKPRVRVVPIAQLVLDEKNANKGTKRGRQLLEPMSKRIRADQEKNVILLTIEHIGHDGKDPLPPPRRIEWEGGVTRIIHVAGSGS